MKCMLLSTIRGKNSYLDAVNNKIVQVLENNQHKVVYDHALGITQEQLDAMSPEENIRFHKKVLDNIKTSDIVIAECTNQSLSVGYLISYALDLNKPTIILYQEDAPQPNLFPTLNSSDLLLISKYKNTDDLGEAIKEYAEYAAEKIDVRFNFFISPTIGTYLDWISKNNKIPRSVYLRNLIEKDMQQNEEFNN